MTRILFGLIAPFLTVGIFWVIGNPSAMSLFWKSAQATVIDHTSFEAETGFGPATFHLPVVQIGGETDTRRRSLTGAPERDLVEQVWPIGTEVQVKLSPSGAYAYRVNDPRRKYGWHFAALAVGLIVIGFTLASYVVTFNAVSLLLGGIGAVFLTLPLLIAFARWQMGNPPPLAHVIWPTEQATIIDRGIVSQRIGNGTTRYTPVLTVQYDGSNEPWRVEGYRSG
ncbi:MAG: hypothetical protein AAGF20_13405, partial [Pseudomonadota bacterium]